MPKIDIDSILGSLTETVLIPLYYRCLEHNRPGGLIRDPKACRIVEALDYDFRKLDRKGGSLIGVGIRTRHFDEITRKFIMKHDDPVMVSLGCGLDDRAGRMDMERGTYYNLDLPEVMRLRDTFMPPDERNISIHDSMFTPGWMERIRDAHPDGRFLVIAEGVLMYFEEEVVRSLIRRIGSTLNPGELIFDATTSVGCTFSSRHKSLEDIDTSFKWALDDNALPEQWAALKLKDVTYFLNKERLRWGLKAQIMSLLPAFAKSFMMLHYDILPPRP